MSRCYAVVGAGLPWLWGVAIVAAFAGLGLGLWLAPLPDGWGEASRILVLHVPAAWMAMLLYPAMALSAAFGLRRGVPLASLLARALAPTGALMAFLALWTGALWGKPVWGAWWLWDARQSSALLLLLLYLGVMTLQAAVDNPARGDRAAALLALVGVVNVPVVYFSVRWWQTLHQGATLHLAREPMGPALQWALALTTLGFGAWSAAAALHRLRSLILERERGSEWVALLPEATA